MKKSKAMLTLAIDDELKEELINEAKEKGLMLSAYVRMILIERKK